MKASFDYIVVGSGLAGLTFGALMARSGRRVRVLEAHDVPGGFGHTYVEAGGKYRFNAQLHYVWNCGPGQPVHQVLDRLGLVDEVTFGTYDHEGFDRMRMPGHALDIPADYDALRTRLVGLFPRHIPAIDRFLLELRGTADEVGAFSDAGGWSARLLAAARTRRLVRYRNATVQDVFDRCNLPLEAQTLLALQWPDFLLPPAQLSWLAWVLLFDGYMRGPYYPQQHFEHVVGSLVRVIEAHGGEVLLNRKVVRFIVNGDAVEGVVTRHVDQPDVLEEHRAEGVVCNMDPRRAAEMIGLDRFSGRVRRKLDYEYSPSNFVAYLVVKDLDLRAHGFGKSNLFHTEQPDLNQCFEDMYVRGDYSRPSFALTTPTLLTDAARDCPPDCTIVELLTVANYQHFLDLKISDEKAYRRQKTAILNRLLDIIERDYVPGFRDHMVFKMTGGPTTNERFCHAPRGNSYGSNMTPAQMGLSRLDYRTSLRRFWFCNASAGYAGFAGTVWTGRRLFEALTDEEVRG